MCSLRLIDLKPKIDEKKPNGFENFNSYPEAHNQERETSMRSCHGVFTDQFIIRTVFARILNIF